MVWLANPERYGQMQYLSLIHISPHFVVFYNGEEEQPEVQELKLSDAFEKPTDEPNLELKCKVYNINDGKNKAIRCV